ncbi:4Fe-4S binding protein [Candidatus Poribacteria bacterium]
MKGVIFITACIILAVILVSWLLGERWSLMRRSTWEAAKAGGLRNLLNFRTLHMYVYLRCYKLYVRIVTKFIVPHVIRRFSTRGRKRAAGHQHSKILTPEMAQAIITNDRDIPLHDLEQIIPYSMARDLVLTASPDIAVCECPCRHARKSSCQPTEVCMLIGQPFVDFSLEHNPQNGRRIAQSEALEILRDEHERGHIHTAWFKDALLNRFYSICNCCNCCCGGIEAMVRYGIPVLASSGYIAMVDEENCAACSTCANACSFGAVRMGETAIVNWEACMGCGVCAGQCPNKAISLERDERKGTPMDVRLM